MKCLLLRLAIVLLILIAAGFGGAAWWGAGELACPPRRALQDYHREFLLQPEAHGVQVESFTLGDGTPCLMLSPLATGAVGKRGQLLRRQLQERGVVLPPPGTVCGSLVLVHGRRGRKEDHLTVAERLCAVGFRCIVPDLPAHGDHPAPVAGYGMLEAGLPARALNEAARRFHFHAAPAGLLGLSMGGAVTIEALARNPSHWDAAVVLATFDSLDEIVRQQVSQCFGGTAAGVCLPLVRAAYLLRSGQWLPDMAQRHRKAIASLRTPLFVAHGSADPVIPLATGRRLFATVPETTPKQWLEVPRAKHHDILVTDFPLFAELATWLLARLPDRTGAPTAAAAR